METRLWAVLQFMNVPRNVYDVNFFTTGRKEDALARADQLNTTHGFRGPEYGEPEARWVAVELIEVKWGQDEL